MARNDLVLQDPLSAAGRGEPLELLLYWRTVYKWKWWIIVAAIIAGGIAAVAVSFVTPMYRATVTLMIEQNKARLVSIDEVYSGVSANREHYQTQAEMLKSPALAASVIKKFDLTNNAEFDPRRERRGFWTDLLGMAGKPQTEWTQSKVEAVVLADFLRRVSIEPIRLSQLVKLSFEASDPKLAARIANEMAEAYLEADVEVRGRITQRAGDWLAERVAGLKQNLEDSERTLQRFREREGLLEMRGLPQGGATRQVEVLTNSLTDVQQRRFEAEAAYKQLTAKTAGVGATPVVLRSGYVETLIRQEDEAGKRLAALSIQYGPEHPRTIAAQKDLQQRRENTNRGIQSTIASFGKEVEVAGGTERAVARNLGAAKGAIQQINRKEFELEALERDVASNRQIYERFLTRYRETRAAGDVQSSVVARVVDPAIPPGSPFKPAKDRIILVCGFLGLLLGAVVALMRERIDSTVRSADEVDEKLGAPALAVLPLLEVQREQSVGRYYLDDPGSHFSEAIRTARTSLLLSAIDAPHKVLLVTSSVPNEGKSAFASNLALAHAQTRKVLLVEADLRRPAVTPHLQLDPNKPGLTSLFNGSAPFADCVQRVEGSSLYVLPAGPVPANPLELLSSERFRHLIARLSQACDLVIIDSPPVHLVSDAVLLASAASGVLFVVKADSTPAPVARRCIRTLREAGGNVIGVVLNQLDFTKAARYYGGYAEYGKKSGEYGGSYSKPAQAS